MDQPHDIPADPAPSAAGCEIDHSKICVLCKKPKDRDSGPRKIDGHIPDIYNQLKLSTFNKFPQKNPRFKHCMPPNTPVYEDFSVFFAGSIEMGKAVQWQPLLANILCDLPITVNNPRRGEWDPNITPTAENLSFRGQVEWELDALTKSTVICFFFDINTSSPVTMCELGLWAHSGKVVVCCDKKFWKGGNVHLVCERYQIPLVTDFKDLPDLIRAKLRTQGMVEGMLVDKDGNMTQHEENLDYDKSMTMVRAEELLASKILKREGQAPNVDVMTGGQF